MVDLRLKALLAELPGAELVSGDPETVITGVEHDSRSVAQGSLFAAIPGCQRVLRGIGGPHMNVSVDVA